MIERQYNRKHAKDRICMEHSASEHAYLFHTNVIRAVSECFTHVISAVAMEAVVCLEYNDLVAELDLTSEIERAFGYNGLGILTVRGVPRLLEAKMALLPLGHRQKHGDCVCRRMHIRTHLYAHVRVCICSML
jgi:hypothetical protein